VPINIVYYTIFFMATQPLNPNQQTLGQAVGKAASNVFNRTLGRLFGAGLNKGAEKGGFGGNPGSARWTTRNGATDWRLKLTIPSDSALLQKIFFNRAGTGDTGSASAIMEPLAGINGIVFPVTPTVLIQHTASYSQLATTHANYPYYAYQHSEPSSIAITGEFPVQNQSDAAHWVATIHFLRSVTKMFFGGDDATRGNPPPILKLNGYGNHVFKNVPVIVTNFTCDLRADVDYVSTTQGSRQIQTSNNIYSFGGSSATLPTTWAPSLSTITLQVQPVYSRDTVKNFSMQKFVNGNLHNFNSNGGEGIGFI
jgi:hypothetical protein